GTVHAGKIKAYIQFCLAITAQALNQKYASPTKSQTTNDKYSFRVWLLRLGMIGDEFKTAREHLLSHLEGCIAWRDPAQALQQKERLRKLRAEQTTAEQDAVPEPAPTAEMEEESAEEEEMSMSMSM
ncbi:MAG: virulence associated protein, partial [Christensenellaceae bacterium]